MTTVDVVGAELGGLILARGLLQRGATVRLWERARSLQALAGRVRFGELGIAADYSYHAILPGDATLLRLIDELGLRPALHARATRAGFYHGGRTYPLNTAGELLRFPPLSALDRARLGYTIMAARQVRDWRALDHRPALEWLRELGGESLATQLWEPLLSARFDTAAERVPATYIWSRLLRAANGSGATHMMHSLAGGHGQLIEALARDIVARGGTLNLGASVEQLRLQAGRIAGLRVDGQIVAGDAVAVTLPTPAARALLPAELAGQSERWGRLSGYLDRVCVLAVLRRRVTPYYTLNVTDPRVPFTRLVETTNMRDPALSGEHHLVYLPRYVAPGGPLDALAPDEIARIFTTRLLQLFPDLSPADIVAMRTVRQQWAEPLHLVDQADDIPPIVGDVPGLFLANAAQTYPSQPGAEAVAAHAALAAEAILSALRRGESRPLPRALAAAPMI